MNQPELCSIASLKSRQKKVSVVAAVISILAFVTLMVAQTPSAAKSTTEPSEVAAIDAYSKELDAFKNSKGNRARILGAEVDQTEVSKWKEFESQLARENAFFEHAPTALIKKHKLIVA